jgi:hypothetical protein
MTRTLPRQVHLRLFGPPVNLAVLSLLSPTPALPFWAVRAARQPLWIWFDAFLFGVPNYPIVCIRKHPNNCGGVTDD